jgi:hypothetical protein
LFRFLRPALTRLVVLKVSNPEEAEIIYDGPGEPAWAAAGKLQKNGQRTIRLSKLKRLNQETAGAAGDENTR